MDPMGAKLHNQVAWPQNLQDDFDGFDEMDEMDDAFWTDEMGKFEQASMTILISGFQGHQPVFLLWFGCLFGLRLVWR